VPPSLLVDAAAQQGGFSWVNLAILVVVALVAWPLYKKLRASISRSRRERWAREEQGRPFLTKESDPDLRREDAPPSDDSGAAGGTGDNGGR